MTTWNRVAGVVGLLALAGWLGDPQAHGARYENGPIAQTPLQSADLVLRGGKIVTVDEARPEAEAIAGRADAIVAAGSRQDIQRHIGPTTRIIDLRGALAVPGLIDAHAHFTGVGEAARNLKLATAKNWDEASMKPPD